MTTRKRLNPFVLYGAALVVIALVFVGLVRLTEFLLQAGL